MQGWRYKCSIKNINDAMTAVSSWYQTITESEIIPLLVGYQLLPQLLREVLIDQAIAEVKCTQGNGQRMPSVFSASPLNQHFKPGLRVTA